MIVVHRFLAVAFLLAFSMAAHAEPPPGGGELSFDGLQRVDSKRFALVWLRPGADFSVYEKLLVIPAEISYKRPPKRGPGTRDNFELDEGQMKRLRKYLREAFTHEIVEHGGWEIVQEPGPDVLLARGGLIDMVVHVPPQAAGRSRTYVRSYGEATLVIELYDSQSREILARVADREAAEPPGGRLGVDIEAAVEVRRSFASWAKRFREALDEVKARKP